MQERSDSDQSPFLTATWSNLCILTYPVPPELLADRVPPDLELDTRDGEAFVSLVAFQFTDTRVWGIGWPGFRNFPEVNLRFYVRRGDRRGVVFIRELVPQPFVAWMAGVFYHEPYESTPMECDVERDDGRLSVEHRWSHGGELHRVRIEAEDDPYLPDESTDAHYFKEHQWGFGLDGDANTHVYEVHHPVWETYPVERVDLDVDWDEVYGPEFDVLRKREPTSVVLAKGSPVDVFSKRPLES